MIRCENTIFVLETQNTQYILGVDKYGYNHHLHWGKKCDINDFCTPQIGDQNSNHSMLDAFRQEYTPFGKTMYRGCAVKAEFFDGCREINLQYDGYAQKDDCLELQFSDTVYPLQ